MTVKFQGCTYDFKTSALIRDGAPVALQRKTAAILGHLIANRGRIVSRDELMRRFWTGVAVSPSAVEYQIAAIRRALGASRQDQRLLATHYGEGWQFVAEVQELAEPPNASSPGPPPETDSPQTPKNYFPLRWTAILVPSLLLGIVLARPNNPAVTEFTELTNDGQPKNGPILTDGKRLFFREGAEDVARIVSIPISGGAPVPLPIQPRAYLQDISSDGKRLLYLLGDGSAATNCVWQFSAIDNSTKRLFCGVGPAAAWHGRDAVSFAAHDSLFDRDLNYSSEPRKLADVGIAWNMRWSSDGKSLRFTAGDLSDRFSRLFELERIPRRLDYLEHGQQFLYFGVWTADGKYFFYQAGNRLKTNLWVEKLRVFIPFAPRSFQLTHGPASWSSPAVGRESTTLFAIHREDKPTLVHFNSQTHQWEERWDGPPDYEFDYSPDRQWIAFTHQPDHTIWKSNSDGTGRLQLTAPGLNAHQPHWSRDGRQIAFVGQNAKGQYRIFVVPSQGGAPDELQPQGDDQGVPTWSPDNRSILFGELQGRRPRPQMCLHVLDLKSRKIQPLSGTSGLWSPRWSPDGKSILAVATDSKTIRLSPPDALHWRDVVSMHTVDNATWSYDSRYIYFDGMPAPGPFALYRVNIATNSLEKLVDLTTFVMPEENWFGISPGGELLASKNILRQEICALRCRLP